uniref:FAD dependent oxidoreductase domain-containing protein n=1 Tax=Chromera velia CCMP2878 TaxID=1169474 RepID=A0A0G4FXE8_9ALVE|eukprot:Cvel_19258.t1-p1 / transcript=Cvel_19258.t1 / gene=Cvel_19258 / organism=Chromera_velia_CCMP2878 / gene_product=D-amino acid dehydrogenase small subunit, putative / transcript_product=D-amino acid dehydrogenase small subunit, putative / location=Cvel_scaffold1648:29903-32906(+) / protein_length=608 / sequence_SO=supercontig / SO=protein_coding / is_pseudo=false
MDAPKGQNALSRDENDKPTQQLTFFSLVVQMTAVGAQNWRRLFAPAAAGLVAGSIGFCRLQRDPVHCDKQRGSPSTPLSDGDGRSRPRCYVIGAGVVGVSTAYEVAKQGFDVVVLDSGSREVAECSRAATGGMQRMVMCIDFFSWLKSFRSFLPSPPWAKPPDGLPFWHAKPSHTLCDLHFLRWFLTYTLHGMPFGYSVNRKSRFYENLKFTTWAIDEMIEVMKNETGGGCDLENESGFEEGGAMKFLLSKWDYVDHLKMRCWDPYPDDERVSDVVDREELLQAAPWVKFMEDSQKVEGALVQPKAAYANCHWFGEGLARACEKRLGIEFKYNCCVTGWSVQDGRVKGLETSSGSISLQEGDTVVVAAGSWTPLILRKAGVYVPIYPLKGYNVVVPLSEGCCGKDKGGQGALEDGQEVPEKGFIKKENLYVCRVNRKNPVDGKPQSELRVSCGGEFDGWNTQPDPSITASLRREGARLFPRLASRGLLEEGHSKVVCGLRPFSADGILISGKLEDCGMENVFVNAGPGSNGWKTAIGAGRLLAILMAREFLPTVAERDAAEKQFLELPFKPQVFGTQGRVLKAPRFCKVADRMSRTWKVPGVHLETAL